MLNRLIVLSGTIGSGKSTVGRRLVERFGIPRVSTREVIQVLRPDVGDDRVALQVAGTAINAETNGRWVVDGLGRWIAAAANTPDVLILDAVRQPEQLAELRSEWSRAMLHVHIDADTSVRKARYEKRGSAGDGYSFDEVIADRIEAEVHRLADLADLVVDSTYASADDIAARIAGAARLYGNPFERLVDVVIGGQWGSEGKGQIAAYIAPEYEILIRVGGPNAGHSVFAEPTPMKFHHLPSGWGRNQEALLVLGPGAVIRVEEFLKEVNTHQVPVDRLLIDPAAMVVTSDDLANEALLQAAIGSTRQGVGSATSRKVMRVEGGVGNWRPVQRAGDHPDLAQFIRPTTAILEEAYRSRRRVLLEGTQGTLLSLHHGNFPYVTSRDTTVAGCLSEAGIATSRVRRVVMTCRTYPIRVRSPQDETSGPMGKEIGWDVISSRSGIPEEELRKAEHTTTTNKLRRVAEFSWEKVRLAALLNGPTDIALTFVDYIRVENRSARRFGQLTKETQAFVEAVEQLTNAPVSLIAKDFSMSPIIDRRQW